jgi:hypothetical protein
MEWSVLMVAMVEFLNKVNNMISTFDDLLQTARTQATPQRLLMVFAGAELPGDATELQRAEVLAGEGGALVPLMCVDKRPDQLESFRQLCAEADVINSGWRMVLAGALPGQLGQEPSDHAVDAVFERWLAEIQSGNIKKVIAQTLVFTREGNAVQLGA